MPQMKRMHPALWAEPPLPGHTPCLTVQLNATYHREAGSCRWTAILRDPEGNIELGRLIGLTQADNQDAVDAMFDDLASILAMVDYHLHGTVETLKEELASAPPPPEEPPTRRKRATTSH